MSSTKGKHKQQLQVEIEQVLSKVDELRTSFQQHWDKLENGTPANREKTENLLRADLDKLKRLRKQIQTLMDLPEVATTRNKLKRCTDAIEADMRRHYILERESKTKQFSNVALNDENEKRAGPRASTQAWLDLCLTELNNRLEDLRSQLDGVQLQGSTKKNMKITKVNAADKLIVKLEEHKEQLEDIIAAYEEGYVTHADIELYLKKSLDEVIRACKGGADIDITTVIYDDIMDLIRTNRMCGSIESFEEPAAEYTNWTPSSAKSPRSGNKIVKEVQSGNDKGTRSISPNPDQDDLDEITFSDASRVAAEGDAEAYVPMRDLSSNDRTEGQTTNTRQTMAPRQANKTTKQGKSSFDIINSEHVDGSKVSQTQTQQQGLPPIKGVEQTNSTRVVRPVFQMASQLSYLRPSPLKENTLIYVPAVTPAAMALYSLKLPKSLMLCTKPHAFKDVVPDLPRSISLLSTQTSNEHQALNDVAAHNIMLEFKYSERPISKIWITMGTFNSERGKTKPYYTYNPGTSMMSKQQLTRLTNVRKAMTELRTKGRAKRQDHQTPSLSDNNDTGSTSSFDLDAGGSDPAHFTAEDGFHVASGTGEGPAVQDSAAKSVSGGESVYPQVYSVRRFVNAPCALSSDHDLAETKWFANRPPQALIWLVTNIDNNRIRQLAAAGLQQQGYRYDNGQWTRETVQ